jgi:hypothetical protein
VRLPATACGGGTVSISDGCGTSDACQINNIHAAIALDKYNVDLSPGAEVLIFKSGGVQPWAWSVSGDLVNIGGGEINSTYIRVRLPDTACGGGTVSISDGCGTSDACQINNIHAAIALDKHNVDLSPGADVYIYKSGGVQPWAWSVSGDLVNIEGGEINSTYIQVRLTGINGGTVTITDKCGTTDNCNVY